MAKTNIYLESKPRYEILDGLRGVAAENVTVVVNGLFGLLCVTDIGYLDKRRGKVVVHCGNNYTCKNAQQGENL